MFIRPKFAYSKTKFKYKSMKQYLKALQEYEENNDRLKMLCHYLAVRNSNLIKQYRDGAINLPSFMLLKKLHNKYSALSTQDAELNNLFLNAIECSKLFYARTTDLVDRSKRKREEFETIFSKEAQPLGQRLINLLINIKFRIRVARLKRKSQFDNDFSQMFKRISAFINPVTCWINDILYKASLIQSAHHRLTTKLYYLVIIASVLSLLFINSLFSDQLPHSLVITINIFLCVLLTTVAVIIHPGGNFGKIDISGKDIVAYKYKVFFNTLSNKKIHNIFTMQHAYESGHDLKQGIESSECESGS